MAVRGDAATDAIFRTSSGPASSTFSVLFWYYLAVDRDTSGLFAGVADAGSTNYLLLVVGANGTQLALQTPSSTVTGSDLTAGVWTHIAFTASGTTKRLYVNGVLNITNSDAAVLSSMTQFYLLGNTSSWTNARVEDAILYDGTALSAAEITAQMAVISPIITTNLWAYYPLTIHTDVTDASGNGRHLTTAGTLATESGPTYSGGPTAPTFVAAGTPAFTATASATVTPGLPSGWAANDIHLLIASGNNNTDWPEPSGWTKLSPGAVAENNTVNQRVELWARRAVGGDSAPVLATYTGTTVRGAQIVGIRGCSTAGTVDTVIAAMSRSNNASSTTATFATVTPGADNDSTLIVALLAYQDNITTAATLSGFTAFNMAAAQQTNLGNDMALSYASRTWAEGAVATGALTSLTSGAAANVSVGILVALEAPPTGTTVNVSASPASAAGTAVNPTLTFSSVTATLTSLPASATGTAVSPSVIQGSLTLTPGAASAAGTAIDPTVSLAGGGLTVNVSGLPASAAGTAISPSVIQSSLTLTPAAASAAGTAVTPTVTITGGGLTVNAAAVPATAVGAAVDPSVRLGSLSINLSAMVATAVGSAASPTVTIAGGGVTVNLTAVPASAVGTAVSPSVRQGSVTVDLAAAAAAVSGTAISPSVIQGSLSLSLAALPALAVSTAVSPSVVLVEAFDFPLSALSIVTQPGAASTAARPGASSSGARAGALSTAARPGATSLATRPASTSDL